MSCIFSFLVTRTGSVIHVWPSYISQNQISLCWYSIKENFPNETKHFRLSRYTPKNPKRDHFVHCALGSALKCIQIWWLNIVPPWCYISNLMHHIYIIHQLPFPQLTLLLVDWYTCRVMLQTFAFHAHSLP